MCLVDILHMLCDVIILLPLYYMRYHFRTLSVLYTILAAVSLPLYYMQYHFRAISVLYMILAVNASPSVGQHHTDSVKPYDLRYLLVTGYVM